jgi:hypothetical protein
MPTIVNIPNVGQVQFPEGMSDADIESAIQKNILPQSNRQNMVANAVKNQDLGGIVGFNTSMGNFAHGILQPLLESGLLGDKVTQASKQVAANREADANTTKKIDPMGERLGELTGDLGQAALIPGGFGKNLAIRALTGAMAGAGLGAAQYVQDGGSRAANAAIGAVGGGILPPTLSGLMSKNPFVKAGIGAGLGLLGAASMGNGDLKTDTIGGLIGAATPFVPGLARAGITRGINKLAGKEIFPNAGRTALNDVAAMNMLNGVDQETALPVKAAADRLGLTITPAEASGSPVAAAKQGALGTSTAGANQLYNFGKNRLGQEQQIVNNLLNDISPNNTIAAAPTRDIARQIQAEREGAQLTPEKQKISSFLNNLSQTGNDVSGHIRNTAKKIISERENALQAKAQPIYDRAYQQKVAPNKIKSLMASDGTIENAINGVLSDPKYRFELNGYAPNSIKVLDIAKRRIDAQIAQAQGTFVQPGDNDAVRVLNDSKKRLLSAIDGFSPTYAQARSIFGEGAKPIEQLRNSNIGKLADLKDDQLKNVSRIIFDPSQTNPQVLNELRDQIVAKNPDVWKSLIRNEMERRLNKTGDDITGDIFNKKILGNQQDFNQFYEATKPFPELNKQILGLRSEFSSSADRLKQLRSTDIARLANLDDTQLKKVSQMIFDPAQTNPSVLKQLKDQISTRNPDVWRQLVRNHLENGLNQSGDYAGTNFYNKFLKNDRNFQQLYTATQGIPGAQQKLLDMRTAFKDLIEPVTAKTAARLAKSSLDVPRSTYEAVMNHAKNLAGGQYDRAAIDLITNNNWDKEFNTIKNIKSRNVRAERFGNLLGKITAIQGVNFVNQSNQQGN